jgi:DNA-binding NarL/FixJ family response regulator
VDVIRVVIVDDQSLVRAGFRMVLASQPDIEVVGEAGDGAEALRLLARTRADVVVMDIRMPIMDGVEATRRLCGADWAGRDQGGRHQSGSRDQGGSRDQSGNRDQGGCRDQSGGQGGGQQTAGGPAGPEQGGPEQGRPEQGARSPRVLVLTTFDTDADAFAALQAGASGFLLKNVPPEDLLSAVRVVAGGEAVVAPRITRRLLDRFAGQLAPRPGDAGRLEQLTDREREVLMLVAQGMSNVEVAERLYVAETTVKTHVGRILTKLGLRDRVQAVVLAYEAGLVRPGQ